MSRFDELTRLVDELNARFTQLHPDANLLPPSSLPLQSDDVPEAGFLRLVSWLWSHYYETGRVTLDALGSVSSVSLSDQSTDHLRIAGLLRTKMQHHLDAMSADDRRKDEVAAAWLIDRCGQLPKDPDDWKGVLEGLCDEAEALLRDLMGVIDRIIDAELGDELREVLRVRLERTIPPYEVEVMIEEMKALYGLDHLDVRAFRDRNYQEWRERARLLAADRDPHDYVRSLVEQSLARHIQAEPAPLSGEDIMDIFGLRPGPDIGRIKRRAEEIFSSGTRAKRELIEMLANEFQLLPQIDPASL